MSLCLLWGSAGAQDAAPGSEPARISLSVAAARRSEPRKVSLTDILSFRDVSEPVLSPDGEWTAFLVRQAFLDCNCYRTALYVSPSVGDASLPFKVLEEDLLSGLRWNPNGEHLTYLSSRSGSRQLWRVNRRGGKPEPIFSHEGGETPTYYESALNPLDATRIGVDLYEWSRDGSLLAFVTRPATDSAGLNRMVRSGVIYDDDRMGGRDILLQQWSRQPAELWIYDIRSRRERRIWRSPPEGVRFSYGLGISAIAWAPDGERIAVTYAAGISRSTAVPNFELGLVTVADGRFAQLVATDSMLESNPAWSEDGRKIAFGSVFLTAQDHTGRLGALGITDVATGYTRYVGRGQIGRSIDALWWAGAQHSLVFETASASGVVRQRSGLYTVDTATGAVRRRTAAKDHISGCSAQVSGQVACIAQQPAIPPAPVVVDLQRGKTTTVGNINPEVRDLRLSPVSEFRWKNQLGVETNGYLQRPPNYVAGRRYPLVVLLYGFQGRFLTAAEWITSYPSQALASAGLVVLLANYPRYDAWRGDDYRRGSAATGYGALSSLEAAVRLLATQGLVDTTKVGIAGWSYGGFLAQFAIAHSNVFHVASVGNDGDYNPGTYWMSGWRGYRRFMENTMGGSPYGRTLANWIAFSPAHNAMRVQVPILMEASSEEAVAGLELYSALRHHNVPVEYVIYPDDGHVLMQPAHRLASMQRNLDWFRYWLLGMEEGDSTKQDQYQRWGALREQLGRLVGRSPEER